LFCFGVIIKDTGMAQSCCSCIHFSHLYNTIFYKKNNVHVHKTQAVTKLEVLPKMIEIQSPTVLSSDSTKNNTFHTRQIQYAATENKSISSISSTQAAMSVHSIDNKVIIPRLQLESIINANIINNTMLAHDNEISTICAIGNKMNEVKCQQTSGSMTSALVKHKTEGYAKQSGHHGATTAITTTTTTTTTAAADIIGQGSNSVVMVFNKSTVVKLGTKWINKNIQYNESTIREMIFLKMVKHKHIIKMIRSNMSEHSSHLYLERFPMTLDKWVLSPFFNPYIDYAYIPYITFQIVSVLASLERHNMVMGDLTPSNIVIDPHTRQIRIIDWGSICMDDTCPAYSLCTAKFAAPEILMCTTIRSISISDVFALGLLIKFLFTKQYESEYVLRQIAQIDLNRDSVNILNIDFYNTDSFVNLASSYVSKDFIKLWKCMLNIDFTKRISATDIYTQSMFNQYRTKTYGLHIKPTTYPVISDLILSTQHKNQITALIREEIISLMYDITKHFKCFHSIALAVYIFDLYSVIVTGLTQTDYMVTALASLLISTMFKNPDTFTIPELLKHATQNIKPEELIFRVDDIIHKLDKSIYHETFDVLLRRMNIIVNYDIVVHILNDLVLTGSPNYILTNRYQRLYCAFIVSSSTI
jgi:serine/threonine protein kinase